MFNEHESYTKPVWDGGLIVAETFWPIHQPGESGEIAVTLLNDIAKVVEVRRADRSEVFTEGRDFAVRDGKLVIPEGSRIRVMAWEEYNTAEPDKFGFRCSTGGYLLFGEGNVFHRLQYEITYEAASNTFDGQYRPEASPLHAKSRAILDSHARPLKLAFFGDSITYGCNASGLGAGVPPFMPVYPKLASEELERRGYAIHYRNPSVGGKNAHWGKNVAAKAVGEFAPDLCVIAFGMNDASGKRPPVDFIGDIKSIIDTVRAGNPAAEFILVCTTTPNALAEQFVGPHEEYEQPMIELAQAEGCAVLNMTDIQRTIMTRKAYHHFTGNNINHPSDFLARIYAQGVLSLIGR